MQGHTRDRWCRPDRQFGATLLSESINICFIRYGNLSIKILVAFWYAERVSFVWYCSLLPLKRVESKRVRDLSVSICGQGPHLITLNEIISSNFLNPLYPSTLCTFHIISYDWLYSSISVSRCVSNHVITYFVANKSAHRYITLLKNNVIMRY
jgi:hypothetical protein